MYRLLEKMDKGNENIVEKMDKDNEYKMSYRANRVWSGLFILAVGVLFLMKNLGADIPSWFFTWPMLVIGIGLLSGIKHAFRGIGWLIMIAVGGFFLARDFMELQFDLASYMIPAGLILIGFWIMVRPRRRCHWHDKERWKERAARRWGHKRAYGDYAEHMGWNPGEGDERTYGEDRIDCVSIFGSTKATVVSKNFKGGEAVAIFGGCDINMSQADFEGTIIIEAVQVFGGTKIIIPPNWEVKSDMVAIFGGIEDKRSVAPTTVGDANRKILKIEGVSLFGGIEIKSY